MKFLYLIKVVVFVSRFQKWYGIGTCDKRCGGYGNFCKATKIS